MQTVMELEAAVRAVLELAAPSSAFEQVPLAEARTRRLAIDLTSAEPWPSTDRSAMDGFAIAGAGDAVVGQEFPVVGEALAGNPFPGELRPGEAVRIMTGAVVPAGAVLVAKVEDTSGFDGVDGDRTRVRLDLAQSRGANIRPRGSELAAGAVVLRAGTLLRAAEIGVLAVLGIVAVPVLRRPRVAIVSTGDEVVDAASEPEPHQVRDSNSWALAAQCAECGAVGERFGIVPDDRAALRASFARGLEADVLLTIGGVSKGTHDLVHGTLAELGVREVFHGVKLKPGKPTFFGVREQGGRRTFVFGLPGNPASTFATFDLFVAPLLARLLGGTTPELHARLDGAVPRSNARTQAVPARLVAGADGSLTAVLTRVRPSGDPFGLCEGDVHAIVPAGAVVTPGARLRVVPFAATARFLGR